MSTYGIPITYTYGIGIHTRVHIIIFYVQNELDLNIFILF